MKKVQPLLRCVFLGCLLMIPTAAEAQVLPEEAEAQTIAKQTYVCGFPLVMNCKTMYQFTVDSNNPDNLALAPSA